jgi:flagellar biosynthetic protein FliP
MICRTLGRSFETARWINASIIARIMVRIIALLACALIAHVSVAPGMAQGLGPPIPTEPAEAPGGLSVLDAAGRVVGAQDADPSAFNPLEVLDGAARALPRGAGGGSSEPRSGLSTAINIMLVLTVLSLAPSIMLMATCFVRILIVLGLLKQALGTATVPPPQVITALALFMTLIVMTPTIERINKEAVEPYRAGEVKSVDELWNRGKQPVRDFMFDQIEATGNWTSVYMILEYRGVDTSRPDQLTRASVDMVTLVPAYMLSELKVAFLMGFRIYLPFLVIDLIVSTMLISMSMMMLPPVLISLPFKLLLFVLVDGWTLVVAGLLHSFAQPDASAGVVTLHDMLPWKHAGPEPTAMLAAALQETRAWLVCG